MKWLHLITVFIFGSFVVVQYNDPDFLKWAIIYLPMCLLPLFLIFGRASANVFLVYGVLLLIYSLTYLDDYGQWSADGMPSIIELDTPNVEAMREFFGLLLTTAFALSYWMGLRKKSVENT